jgi:hypothetical protein
MNGFGRTSACLLAFGVGGSQKLAASIPLDLADYCRFRKAAANTAKASLHFPCGKSALENLCEVFTTKSVKSF